MQDLRGARNKKRVPQSLSALAINSVYTNFTRFVEVPDSPLKYLPNSIVQQLLLKITSDVKNEKSLMTLPLLMQVLGLLVNPNVTELNCNVFEGVNAEKQKINHFLVKHAVQNCPKLRKIKLRNRLRTETCDLLDEHQCLTVKCIKKSWNNLTTILCSEWYIYKENTIMLFEENFPNIEELAVVIVITESTEQTMLDHFIKMKRLHTLNLTIRIDDSSDDSLFSVFVSDVAGAVPSLRYFNFKGDSLSRSDSIIIALFGENYPNKTILVNELILDKGLKEKWPKNLSAKHLIIDCELSDTEIENLSTIECKLDLTVNCVFEQTYKVVDCIGGRVKSLTMESKWKYWYVKCDTEIILERILAACPNLEHFKLEHIVSVVQDLKYNLSPADFKNYKSFEIGWDWSDRLFLKEVVLQEVYQKFLIGTEVCETIKNMSMAGQLETLAQVALAYPESLQQLRELHFKPLVFFYCCSRISNTIYEDEIVRFDKCFYELFTSCHNMERILFVVHCAELVKKLKPENRHHFTIQSIDPHFINYCDISTYLPC